jgi:serine/threonine-protein kinase HipA
LKSLNKAAHRAVELPGPMAKYNRVDVYIWDRLVGRLIEESETKRRIFQYDENFAKLGLEISPINLPCSDTSARAFTELVRSNTFEGLPGVIADSLPDKFGSALIQAHFENKGLSGKLTPLQKLLYLANRGPGALEYRPAEHTSPEIEDALQVGQLVDQARKVVVGETTDAIAEIISIGATVGGARPKAVILWNRSLNRVRSGHATPESGDEYWIIKFDGVTKSSGGLDNRVTHEPGPWGQVEYAYSKLAEKAGIEMTETFLLHDNNGLAHFMTRRFDRSENSNEKIHMHTLGGMLHLDYEDQYQIGYEDYFDAMRRLGLSQPSIEEAFRRMVFAIATVNYDDHLKNFSFLMNKQGTWSLSPAYDISFAENNDWTSQHQMAVAGKFHDINRLDCLKVATSFDIRKNRAEEIIDKVLNAVESWDEESKETGLGTEFRSSMKIRLEKEMAPLRAND